MGLTKRGGLLESILTTVGGGQVTRLARGKHRGLAADHRGLAAHFTAREYKGAMRYNQGGSVIRGGKTMAAWKSIWRWRTDAMRRIIICGLVLLIGICCATGCGGAGAGTEEALPPQAGREEAGGAGAEAGGAGVTGAENGGAGAEAGEAGGVGTEAGSAGGTGTKAGAAEFTGMEARRPVRGGDATGGRGGQSGPAKGNQHPRPGLVSAIRQRSVLPAD